MKYLHYLNNNTNLPNVHTPGVAYVKGAAKPLYISTSNGSVVELEVSTNDATIQIKEAAQIENPITIYIDGVQTIVNADKTWADNGYCDLFSESSYTDYYNDSEESFRIETNGYPSEGDSYYTTCEYEANMVTVTINDEEKQVDANKYWYDNGYETLYTQNYYTDYYNESSSNYEVNVYGDFPAEGDTYYTTCEYQENLITVTIDDEEVQVDSNKYWYDNEYYTIYAIGNYDDNCESWLPTEGEKYSTDYISVIIDGSETNVSTHYTFTEQGYDTMYYKNNGESCENENPADSYEYLTACIEVSIDDTYVYLNPNKSFAEQGYNTIHYNSGSGFGMYSDHWPSGGFSYYTYERTED